MTLTALDKAWKPCDLVWQSEIQKSAYLKEIILYQAR